MRRIKSKFLLWQGCKETEEEMSTFHDERESCHIAYARFLFIKTEGEEVPAPVVILQNDIHNVFGILEKHFHPKYLPQPDKYWKTIRTVLDIDSWRPRVNGCVGCQLKMLHNARLPHGMEEWAMLAEAIASISGFLQPKSTVRALLGDLEIFVSNVEIWWNSRRRDGNNKRDNPYSLTNDKNKRRAMAQGPQKVVTDVHGIPLFSLQPGQVVQGDREMVTQGGPTGQMMNWMDIGGPVAKDVTELQNGNRIAAQRPEKSLVNVNVGGKHFSTTKATLEAVPGSYFAVLVSKDHLKSRPTSEYYIDRSHRVFEYVLDHLRLQRYHPEAVSSSSLPDNIHDLNLLLLDCKFYKLPALQNIVREAITKAEAADDGNDGLILDDVYIETSQLPSDNMLMLERARRDSLAKLNDEICKKQRSGLDLINCQTYVHAVGAKEIVIRYHALLGSQSHGALRRK